LKRAADRISDVISGAMTARTAGAEVIDELKPAAGDFVVTKVRSSAFYGTKMEALLRVKGIWILVVAGGSTNWGVEWLARDAKARDIVTVALRDCTYSGTPEAQAASLANIDDFIGYVMESQEVRETLAKAN
jgi:ureidoacrylate peracid hydrolase